MKKCVSYLSLRNSITINLVALNNTRLSSHSFWGSGIQAQLSWVPARLQSRCHPGLRPHQRLDWERVCPQALVLVCTILFFAGCLTESLHFSLAGGRKLLSLQQGSESPGKTDLTILYNKITYKESHTSCCCDCILLVRIQSLVPCTLLSGEGRGGVNT